MTAGQPLAPLPPRLALLAGVDAERELDPATDAELVAAVGEGSARAEELPEMAELAAGGWRPLEPAPVYVGVPAAWPAQHCGWVPDRLPGLATTAAMGVPRRCSPPIPTSKPSTPPRGLSPPPLSWACLGWFAYGTSGDRAQRSYQVSDPLGTRGRTAHEQRERERRPW